ncbi:hypothetical protein LTR36_006085 [Oleoguttula mirabilis]|uniref:Uncharacterized protein n=1 Tax=Oleoguttula mirabilis TaxID=1507867 RepID=A0AAV9JDK7_9PEZI|nr:hypothetical protein LTR36_006085 [Oleoguttula mirabilis]
MSTSRPSTKGKGRALDYDEEQSETPEGPPPAQRSPKAQLPKGSQGKSKAQSSRAAQGSSKTAQRPEEAKAATKARQSSSHTSTKLDDEKSRTVTPIEVEQAPHLKNWKRWAGLKDSLRLSKLVEGKTPSLLVHRIESVLAPEAREDQQWELEKLQFRLKDKLPKNVFEHPESMTSDYWRVILKDVRATKQVSEAKRQAWIPVACLPSTSESFARRVAEQLCALLNHSPIAAPTLRPADVTAQLLVLVAVHRAIDERGDLSALITRDLMSLKAFIAFNVAWDPDKKAYLARLLTYDEELKPQKGNTRLVIRIEDVTQTRQIPSIPNSLGQVMPEVTNRDFYEGLSDAEKSQHDRAVQLCHHVQYVMFGACGDKDAVFQQAASIAGLHKVKKETYEAGNTKNLSSLYDGQKLFSTRHLPKFVKIRPSVRAEAHIEGPNQPEIHVIGHSKARVSAVLECATQEFLDGRNYLDSFQAGVRKADSVNMTPVGKSFIHGCDHTETERLCKVHVCQHCNGIVFCADMEFASDVDLRVCPDCASRSLTSEVSRYVPEGHTRKGHAPSVMKGRRFRAKLLAALRQDTSDGLVARKASLEPRQAVADAIAAKWLDELDETWEDQFFDAKRPDSTPNVSSTRTSAFVASPDAVTPFHVEDGKVTYHHEDSVVPTAAYANQGTNTWLKGNLQAIQDAQALRESADQSIYGAINNRLDHLWAIRTQYPWLRKARLDIQMDDHEFQRCLDEWKEGVLNDAEETVPFYIHYKGLKTPLWTVADRSRINDLIRQMRENFSDNTTPMPRGTVDKAPFPWRPEHMPKDWSWAKLEGHMAYHFELMDWWCDWMFVTGEDSETLLLELIWQWMENGGRDPFLRLPMTVFAHHAAGWAIGHVHHGLPMRTRWPAGVRITDIDQRVDERCNVVIEPRIANYMKMDYPEEEYPLILEDLKLLKDHTEWFHRPGVEPQPLKVIESKTFALERSYRFCRSEADGTDSEDFEEVDASDVESDFDDEDHSEVVEDDE